MDQLMGIFTWLKSNGPQIALVITSVIGTASVIVKLTPTQKDDTILAKVVEFVSKFIALNDTKHV